MSVTPTHEFRPGTEVEVRTRYLSNWTTGFEVVSVNGDRVGLRRRSDGAILPVALSVEDIRPRQPFPRVPEPLTVPKPRRR
jgi:hypothetical protein